ncbi:MAG: hypothetical protein ACYTG6_04240 [Planctomycetota bacterium]|jgi:hypothetical protein
MDRRGFLIGFLAGGWIATLLVVGLLHFGSDLGFRQAQAEDPVGPPVAPLPTAGGGPNGPVLPGPTVNPLDGPVTPRGGANPGGGTSDSNRRAIALSASVGSGESVVYYFDTVASRLCVYQYKPGNRGGLRLLAARYIDFDLRLEQYRDLSERSPREMREAWEEAMGVQAPANQPGGGSR